MKSIILAFSLIFSFTSLANNQLQAQEGHGASGILCHEDTPNAFVQLLDLYEAPILYGINPTVSDKPYIEQFLSASVKISPQDSRSPQIENELYQTFAEVNSIKRFLPPGNKLDLIDDSLAVVLPIGCRPVQLAIYVNSELLLIDSDYWALLSETGKAALLAHEAIYLYERRHLDAKDSRNTRKVVGHLFSSFNFIPPTEGIPKDAWSCETDTDDDFFTAPELFYVYSDSKGRTIAQFLIFEGKISYSKRTAVIKAPFPLRDKKGDRFFQYVPIDSNFTRGERFSLALYDSTEPEEFGFFRVANGRNSLITCQQE